jgi:hypothetical protein
MRDQIRQRLEEDRAEAFERIEKAVNKTKANFAQRNTLNSGGFYLAVNEDNKAGFAEYMDECARFIRHLARGSGADYADELREGGSKLKQEIMGKIDRENYLTGAIGEPSTRLQLRNDLDAALDKLIKRKVEDFELGYPQGKNMNAITNYTVNIINSNITNSVMQITQSGKDTIWKDIAQKLQEVLNSEDIKGLPEQTQLDVLDQAEAVIDQLNKPVTDVGKVQRGLKRLGGFISSVASKSLGDIVTQLAMKALGM